MDGVAHSRLHLPFGGHRRPTAFQKLSKENRLTLDIVFLRYQGYTYKEIARRIGISESAVRKKISRLRKNFLIFMSQNALSRRL